MIERSLALLFGLIVGALGYVYLNKQKNTIKENFLPPMSYKVDRVMAPNKDFANKGEFWSVPGTYQPLVAPRSASMQYGSQIQYNLPPESLLAYRSDTPFANDGLLVGSSGVRESFANDGVLASDIVQPVTYDRFMFSNKKSRLREHGDPIRGDLPIVPHNSDWFRPSVQPHLDLKEGAMQVMGGFDNDTNNKLSMLMAASAGNAMQTFGGMNFSGDDGLSANMGAFMSSPRAKEGFSSSGVDAGLAQFMSSIPQRGAPIGREGFSESFSNANNAGIFSTLGMVPQSAVQVERSGDVHVMRG